MTFLGLTEHFSGKNGALRWSILVGKQKHNVQKPTAVGASPAAKDHGKASKMLRHMGRLSMTPCTATTAENPKKRLGTRQV